jgi:hypothetical protein
MFIILTRCYNRFDLKYNIVVERPISDLPMVDTLYMYFSHKEVAAGKSYRIETRKYYTAKNIGYYMTSKIFSYKENDSLELKTLTFKKNNAINK